MLVTFRSTRNLNGDVPDLSGVCGAHFGGGAFRERVVDGGRHARRVVVDLAARKNSRNFARIFCS